MAHGGGRDVDVGAEDEDGFEIMDGQRELEGFLVFDAQGEAIAAEREPGGEQVEDVLEGLHAGRDFRFEILDLRLAGRCCGADQAPGRFFGWSGWSGGRFCASRCWKSAVPVLRVWRLA